MLKKLPLLVVWVLLPCYSYSESITPYYSTTPNAAAAGHQWVMDNILPEPPGLEINGVFYSYTPQKVTEDDFKVTVGNENAAGGTLWSDTEDWSGNPGGIEVRKVIGLPNVPRETWGDGYIVTEGEGTVNDATVIYSYKVDPCYDPQFDPNCPGYVTPQPVVVEIDLDSLYDATEDEAVAVATEETDSEQYEEEELVEYDEEEEEEKSDIRLEKALAAVNTTELYAQSLAQSEILQKINEAIDVTSYVNATIPGGVYKEQVAMQDKQISDNKRGLRNGLAQQLLHEKMIEMQYAK